MIECQLAGLAVGKISNLQKLERGDSQRHTKIEEQSAHLEISVASLVTELRYSAVPGNEYGDGAPIFVLSSPWSPRDSFGFSVGGGGYSQQGAARFTGCLVPVLGRLGTASRTARVTSAPLAIRARTTSSGI